jgi:hypothetical protein
LIGSGSVIFFKTHYSFLFIGIKRFRLDSNSEFFAWEDRKTEVKEPSIT